MSGKTTEHAQTSVRERTKKVLLVEDDALDRRVVERLLARCPRDVEFAVESVDTLSATVARLGCEEYDVVLLDLNLPDSAGVDTVHKISKVTAAPIVVLTRQDDEETGILAIRNGATDYLLKDKSLENLLTRTILYALERRKVENELRENEERYRSLTEDVLDTSAVGIIILDHDFRIVWINKALECYFGLHRGEVIGKDKRQLIGERIKYAFEEPEVFANRVLATYDNNNYVEDFSCHTLPDGNREERWLRHWSQPIHSGLYAGGRIEHYYDVTRHEKQKRLIFDTNRRLQETTQELLCAKEELEQKARALKKAHDTLELRVEQRTAELQTVNKSLKREMTSRTQAERALQASEQNLSKLVTTSPSGIVVVGRDGVTKFVNPAAESLFGRNAEELVGETFGLPLARDEVVEVDIVHRGEEPGTAEMRVVDTEWGGQKAYLVLLHDVTDRLRAKEEVTKAAREWRTTFDSITDMISIHNRDWKITRVNTAFAKALRREPKELIGKTCYELLHNAEQPCAGCPHTLTLKTKETATLDMYEPRLGVHLGVTTSPIFDDDGQVIGSVHIAKNVTQRKLAEEKLKEANERLKEYNQLKDEFVSTASHELRTPLSVIMGALRLVLDEIPGNVVDEQREVLCMARDNVQRLSDIVDSLLSISKIESGKLELQKSVIDICDLTKDVVAGYGPVAQEKNIDLGHEVCGHSLDICVDPNKIHAVLANLISNSLKFTPEGGWIRVVCEAEEKRVLLTVRDSGIGIAKEDIPKLFDKFTQFGRREGPGEKGTGLGLAIAKNLVEMHGGTIEVESEVDKGTTFTISLPLTAEAETENLSGETDTVMESTLADT